MYKDFFKGLLIALFFLIARYLFQHLSAMHQSLLSVFASSLVVVYFCLQLYRGQKLHALRYALLILVILNITAHVYTWSFGTYKKASITRELETFIEEVILL